MVTRFPPLARLRQQAEDPQVSLDDLKASVLTALAEDPELPFAAAWTALATPAARRRLGLALDVLSADLPLDPDWTKGLQWPVWGRVAARSPRFTLRALPLLLESAPPLTPELAETLLGLLSTQIPLPDETGLALPPRLFTADELPTPGLQAAFARALLTHPLAPPVPSESELSLRYTILVIAGPAPHETAEQLLKSLDLKWASTLIQCLESAFDGTATVLAPAAPFAAVCDGLAYLRRARVVELLFSLPDDETPPLAQVSFHDEGSTGSVRLGFFDAQGNIRHGLDMPWAVWETPQAVVEGLVTDLRPRGVAQLVLIEDVLPAMRLPDGEPEYPELSAPDLLEIERTP